MSQASEAAVYGQSLYRLATEEAQSAVIMEQLAMVQELLREQPDYITLLSSHQLSVAERVKLLDQAFREALHPYALNTIKLLTERGIMHSFGAAVDAYRRSYYQDNGIAPVTVTSAVPLTAEEREALLEKLTRKAGKKLVLTEKVDPALVGGIKVEMEGVTLDGSVAARMETLRRSIDGAVL